MRNALLVAAREYADNARTKGFWIGIMMVPVILVAFVFVTQWLAKEATPVRHYVLIDKTDRYAEAVRERMDLQYAALVATQFQAWVARNLKEELRIDQELINFENLPAMAMDNFDSRAFIDEMIEDDPDRLRRLLQAGGFEEMVEGARPQLADDAGEFEIPRRLFQEIEIPEGIDVTVDSDEVAESLKPYLRGEQMVQNQAGEDVELFAALIIPGNADAEFRSESGSLFGTLIGANTNGPLQYWSSNLADDDLYERLIDSLNRELRQSQFVAQGIDTQLVSSVQRMSFDRKKFDPDKAVGKEEVSTADKLRELAPIGFVYILWISIMQVASMLLNNTIEEKSNRIIEVLLSSVTAWELMVGKLLGIAGIGMTMLTAWIASAGALLWIWASPEAEFLQALAKVIFDDTLLPAFIFYFLLGYLMYASVFLAIGSICNTLKEAQNFMGPVMMVMMVPIITMMFIPKDPHGTLATVLSWIPVYTPFVMMNRAAADPPAFDIYGTAVLLVISNIAMLWLCGRIFRTGILRTGQPPRLKELFSWVRRSAD